MVNSTITTPTIEDIGDPDWVYTTFNEDRLKEIKRSGILNFIAQWINMTSLVIFALTNDGFGFGIMSLAEIIYYTLVLCMANWTGTNAAAKLSYYSKIIRAQRRYAVRHGLIPWWKQKEFGGWK